MKSKTRCKAQGILASKPLQDLRFYKNDIRVYGIKNTIIWISFISNSKYNDKNLKNSLIRWLDTVSNRYR